jgi:hypothetical protein
MAYLHCARCELQIKIDAPFLHIDNCPRCLTLTGTISPMTLSGSVTPPGRAGDRHEPFVLSLIHSDQRPHHDLSLRLTAIDAAAHASDAQHPAQTWRAGATRRADQGAMAAAIRALRSQQRPRDTR